MVVVCLAQSLEYTVWYNLVFVFKFVSQFSQSIFSQYLSSHHAIFQVKLTQNLHTHIPTLTPGLHRKKCTAKNKRHRRAAEQAKKNKSWVVKMKYRMGSMTVEGANPIVHLLNRQIGNNIYHFRRNLFRERLASARNLYRRNLVAHYGCVNAIEFSSAGDLLISGKSQGICFYHYFTSTKEKMSCHT